MYPAWFSQNNKVLNGEILSGGQLRISCRARNQCHLSCNAQKKPPLDTSENRPANHLMIFQWFFILKTKLEFKSSYSIIVLGSWFFVPNQPFSRGEGMAGVSNVPSYRFPIRKLMAGVSIVSHGSNNSLWWLSTFCIIHNRNHIYVCSASAIQRRKGNGWGVHCSELLIQH